VADGTRKWEPLEERYVKDRAQRWLRRQKRGKVTPWKQVAMGSGIVLARHNRGRVRDGCGEFLPVLVFG
jgi:hypothetical protein